MFPTGSRLRPSLPWQPDTSGTDSSLLYLDGLLDQLPFQQSPTPPAFYFFSVGDLESDICDAWPLSVSITLWVFIGYQFCVLHLFEDLSGRAWHLFLLCVCRAWLPSYLGGDPVRAGVWKGETGEIGVRPVRHSSWAHLLWQEGHLFFRFCLLEPVFVLSY